MAKIKSVNTKCPIDYKSTWSQTHCSYRHIGRQVGNISHGPVVPLLHIDPREILPHLQ